MNGVLRPAHGVGCRRSGASELLLIRPDPDADLVVVRSTWLKFQGLGPVHRQLVDTSLDTV